MVFSRNQMTSIIEKIVNHRVYTQESLSLTVGFESPHAPLPYSGMLMRYLGPVIGVPRCIVNHFW